MGKIQQFKNKPKTYSYGQYYYETDNEVFQDNKESDSVLKPYDKYSNKSLYSVVTSDTTRDYIVDRRLRFTGASNIKINKLTVSNHGTKTHIDCYFRGFIFDKNCYNLFDDDGNIKYSYDHLYTYLISNGDNALRKTCSWMEWDSPNIAENNAPDFSFLYGKSIVGNLGADSELIIQETYANDGNLSVGLANQTSTQWAEDSDTNTGTGYPNGLDTTPFNPKDNLLEVGNRLTRIFSETVATDDNYIQIVIWLKSNKSTGDSSGRSRKRRFYVFKIKPSEFLDVSPNSIAEPLEDPLGFAGVPIDFDTFNYKEGHESKPNDECDMAAFRVNGLSITINPFPGTDASTYASENQDIVNKVEQKFFINERNFDLDFINANLFKEPFTSATTEYSDNSDDESKVRTEDLWKKNFTPFSKVVIQNKFNQNLQAFKTNDLDRQVCSSPTTVELKINISNYTLDNDILKQAFPYLIPPHYKFCVVTWDDKDNKFTTLEDVFSKKPINFNEVLIAQENNTFIFKDFTESFNNNYNTPGIKQIKILVFNYVEYRNGNFSFDSDYSNSYKGPNYALSQMPPFDIIEPIRYKLLTTRIFLDIPVSEFPDFGQVGGEDYKTIPWPYTAPIIGGISQDSKYLKSINDILGGGKIGDTDIIDETFLIDAKENDELGKNIEKLDLEQVRFFNKSYDMNTLLLIPTSEGDSTISPFCDVYSCLATDIFSIQYFSDIPEEPTGASILFAKSQLQGTMTYYSSEGFEEWVGALTGETLVAGYGEFDFDYYEQNNLLAEVAPELTSNDINREFCHPGLGCTGFGDGTGIELPVGEITTIFIPELVVTDTHLTIPHPYTDISGSLTETGGYWDGETNSFSEESSVGQIFIGDNLNLDLIGNCQLELNTGNLSNKSIYDSSGNSNKGLLIGDYKIKKNRKGEPMRKDSFIKVPKKDTKDGAL